MFAGRWKMAGIKPRPPPFAATLRLSSPDRRTQPLGPPVYISRCKAARHIPTKRDRTAKAIHFGSGAIRSRTEGIGPTDFRIWCL
jgi:hypothetical protein